jgi:Cu/Ag efflux protein CusF
MKIISTRAGVTLGIAIISLVCARPAFGDASTATNQEKEKVYKGTVLAVDSTEKTVLVKGHILNKTFNAAETCQVSLEDKPEAALDKLRAGHKVEVYYQNTRGVLVANRIVQHNQVINGYITAVDPAQRTLAIKGSGGKKRFAVAEDCDVLLKDAKVGTLDNLKVGHNVSVAYDPAAGVWTAHKIEQKAETFVGTIQAIDAGTRTVRARSFMSERKFNLADGCRIVVEDKADAGLRDLRIGDRVEFSYEDANGVLVVNRIGREPNVPDPDNAQTAKR